MISFKSFSEKYRDFSYLQAMKLKMNRSEMKENRNGKVEQNKKRESNTIS